MSYDVGYPRIDSKHQNFFLADLDLIYNIATVKLFFVYSLGCASKLIGAKRQQKRHIPGTL